MNNRLRENMTAIIASLKKTKASVDEAIIRGIKLKLLKVNVNTSDDLKLLTEFYVAVRKHASIRDSLSDTELPVQEARETLSKDDDIDVPIVTPETVLHDRYHSTKHYSVAANLKVFKKYCNDLYALLKHNYVNDEKKQARYFVQANKIVSAHRYLMRLLGELSWTEQTDRDYFFKHLTAIYNRLEDFGWLCEGSEAIGLLPLQQNSTEYDNRDFEKKLGRFMAALHDNSSVTPYSKPATSLKNIISRLDDLVIENNQVIIGRAVSSSSSDSSSTVAQSQRSSLRLSRRLSLLRPHSTPAELKEKNTTCDRESESVAAQAVPTNTVVVKKSAMKRKISEMDSSAGSLLTLFSQSNKGNNRATSTSVAEKKMVRFALPDSSSQPLRARGLFSHRRSMLRAAVQPVLQGMAIQLGKK